MDRILTQIGEHVLAQSWQIVITFVLVALACRMLRSASAHWRYLLWLVVLARCLVPPVLTVPVAVLPAQATGAWAWDRWLVLNGGNHAGLAAGRAAPGVAAEPSGQGGAQHSQPRGDLKASARLGNGSEASYPADDPLSGSAAQTADARGRDPRTARITPQQGFAIAWAAGVVLLLALAGIRAGRIHRFVRRSRGPAPADLVERAAALARQLGMARMPAIWLIDGIAQPFVWGVLRGSVYLPGSFAGTGRGDHRRSILMHEFAHVARCDAAVNLVQVVVQAAFFFHPLVWWANRRIRQEREKCCDEVAIAHLGEPPRQYGEAIVSSLVYEYESTRPMSSLAVAGSVRNIEERIKAIMNPHKRFHRGPSWLAVTIVLALAAVVAPSSFLLTARAEGQKPEAPASAPASQKYEPSIFFKAAMDMEAYPDATPDELLEQMKEDLLSDKWKSQDGEFASLTLRNPAPEREARVPLHEEVAVTPAQKELLFDSPMAYITIAGHDEETVTVDATVFVRSATSGEAAQAYAEKIEVELAPSDEYVRLGEHVLKLKPKDIEVAGVIYTVKVPRRFGVDVRMRNGRTYVTGIAGEFVFFGGGALIATNLSGRVFIDKSGGMTLLANVSGNEDVSLNQMRGLIGLLNISAPIKRSILGGALYLDLRKTVPAEMDIDVVRTSTANVVLGQAAIGDLDCACNDGEVVVHQADGELLRAKTFAWKGGSRGPSLKLKMGSGTLNVWAATSLPVQPQSRADGKSADSTAQRD